MTIKKIKDILISIAIFLWIMLLLYLDGWFKIIGLDGTGTILSGIMVLAFTLFMIGAFLYLFLQFIKEMWNKYIIHKEKIEEGQKNTIIAWLVIIIIVIIFGLIMRGSTSYGAPDPLDYYDCPRGC